jgi:hypothetical protein
MNIYEYCDVWELGSHHTPLGQKTTVFTTRWIRLITVKWLDIIVTWSYTRDKYFKEYARNFTREKLAILGKAPTRFLFSATSPPN